MEISAGEGLLLEESNSKEEGASSWLTREPSRVVLFTLCGILLLGLCIFLCVHAACAWRRRRRRPRERDTMAARHRRRRELDGPNFSEEDDGAKMSLKLTNTQDGTGNGCVLLDVNSTSKDGERERNTGILIT